MENNNSDNTQNLGDVVDNNNVQPSSTPNVDNIDSFFEKLAPVENKGNDNAGDNNQSQDNQSQDNSDNNQQSNDDTSQNNDVVDEEQQAIESFVQAIKEETGVEVEFNTDSILKAVKAVKQQNLIEDNEVLAFLEHKKNGGTLETFKQLPKEPNYTPIKEQLTAENISLQEEYALKFLVTIKGLDEEVAQTTIDSLKDNSKLLDFSLKALEAIEANEKADYQAKIDRINQETESNRQKAIEEWNNIQAVANGDKIFGYKLQDAALTKLRDSYKVNENGVLPIVEKQQKLTPEQIVFIDALIANDFDISILKAFANQAPIKQGSSKNPLSSLIKGSGGSAGSQKVTSTLSDVLN